MIYTFFGQIFSHTEIQCEKLTVGEYKNGIYLKTINWYDDTHVIDVHVKTIAIYKLTVKFGCQGK